MQVYSYVIRRGGPISYASQIWVDNGKNGSSVEPSRGSHDARYVRNAAGLGMWLVSLSYRQVELT